MSELVIPPVNNRSKSAAAGADADPFRWLEDSASPETAAWVTAQNQRTPAYLASVPTRAAIRSRLTGDGTSPGPDEKSAMAPGPQ